MNKTKLIGKTTEQQRPTMLLITGNLQRKKKQIECMINNTAMCMTFVHAISTLLVFHHDKFTSELPVVL